MVAGMAALVLAAAAGNCGSGIETCASGACHAERPVNSQFQSSVTDDIDVLFVVDDSAPLPPTVVAAFPGLAEALQEIPPPATPFGFYPSPPSLQVAFVPSSFGSGA